MSNFLKSVWRLWNSPHWGLNPGPSVYKTDALPLSYRGSDAKRYIGRLQTHTISTSFSSLPMHARILGGEGEQRKAKEEQGTREEQWEKKKGNFRERERDRDTATLSDFREIQGYERAKPNRLHLMPWIDSCGIWTHAACASGTWVHPLRPLGQTVL